MEYINLLGNPIKNYEQKLKELLPNLKEINVQKNICDEVDIYNNIILNDNNNTELYSKKEDLKDSINSINNNNESTKLSMSIDIKKSESGETDNVEIVDNNNNIIQELMESKTKFDFKNTNIKDLKPKKDLKPVIAKKKESKEIKILRETFTKEIEKNEIKNINNKSFNLSKNELMNSNKFKKGTFGSGIRALKDMKLKNEKIIIKSKNVNSNKEHKEHKD